MKRFLLALFFLGAAFIGRSQVIFNELLADPSATGNGNVQREYFELYNTGTTPVQLGCYSIVAVEIGNASVVGFRVLDLPTYLLQPKAYFTGGAGASTKIGTSANGQKAMSFNWNDAPSTLTALGASFKRYVPNGSGGYTISTVPTSTTNPVPDLFVAAAAGNVKFAVFLFDGSTLLPASTNATAANGLIAYGSNPASTVPSGFNFATMPDITISDPNNSCSSYNIHFPNVTQSEYVQAATGNNHGYNRGGNGACGTWDKAANVTLFTPNAPNPIAAPKFNSGELNSVQAITCGADASTSTVSFKVLSSMDASAFPVTIELYYDNAPTDSLESNDVLHPTTRTISSINNLPYSDTFSIPAGQKVLLVYRTALGCISKITAPNATASFTTTQYNICNQQIGIAVTNADSTANALGFPVTVNFFNNGTPMGSVSVQQPSSAVYYSNFSATTFDPTQVSVQYIPNNCLSTTTLADATTFASASGTLKTSETLVSNNSGIFLPGKVSANAAGITNGKGYYTGNVLPVEARMYLYDPTATPAQTIADTSYIESLFFRQASSTNDNTITDGSQTFQHVFASNDENKTVVIVYQTAVSCFTKIAQVPLVNQAALPVHFVSFTAIRKDESKVALAWATATEQNNRGFYVQRNTGGEWKDVGLVFSQALNGNSTQELSYSFTDINQAKGVTQYRVLQVDLNGNGHYSATRSVRGSGAAASKLMLFPNPSSTGSVTLVFGAQGTNNVIVSDVSGRTVQQFKNVTGSSLEIKNLTSGFYTVQVRDVATGAISTEKFIVTKR